MSGYIENEDTYVRGSLSILVEPVVLPCKKCRGENYPNYALEEGPVLCKKCLDRQTIHEEAPDFTRDYLENGDG